MWGKRVEPKELIGKTITKIDNNSDELIFECSDGAHYKMFHEQYCCERVNLEEIIGDLEDLIDTPLLSFDEETNSDSPPSEHSDSFTWTFYKLSTIKGYITLRWFGESNGYYSESVELVRLDK